MPRGGKSGNKGGTGNTGNKGGTGGNKGGTGQQGNKGGTGQQGNKGGTGQQGNDGNKKASGKQGNKGGTGQQGNDGNKGGAGKQGNKGGAGKQGNKGGGAPPGNLNSSSVKTKINKLFVEGFELDRRGDKTEALDQYREVIKLDPNHAEAHYNIARLLSQYFKSGDFVTSGSFENIVEHFQEAERCGYPKCVTLAEHGRIELLLFGEHGDLEKCFSPNRAHHEMILQHFKSLASTHVEASAEKSELVEAALIKFDYAQALMICATPENFPESCALAINELRSAVSQDSGSLTANTALATVLMQAGQNEEATNLFRRSLELRPGFLYPMAMVDLMMKSSKGGGTYDEKAMHI
jgi:tetratricopeptide (TPR) repeat protein